MRRTFVLNAVSIAAASAVMSLFVMGCNKPERPHPGGPGIANTVAKTIAQVPKVQVTSDDSLLTEEQRKIVLADLGGGKTITLADLEARLNRESLVVRQQYATIAKRKEYLVNWVQFEILADEARNQGFDKHPEVVQALKQQMVRRYLREAVLETIKYADITDEEVAAYYKNNLHMYQRPAQIELRHILLADEAMAKKVLNELKTGSAGSAAQLNAMWKDYVARVSTDVATVPYLGSLGRVSKEIPEHLSATEKARLAAVPKEVVKHAFLTEVYSLSGVVKSARGYHILMPVSQLPAVNKTLKQVAKTIKGRLLKRKRDLKRKALIATLSARSKVDFNHDAIRVLPIPKPGSPIRQKRAPPSSPARPGLNVKSSK